MSHQTGIQANEDLKHFFGKCKDGHVRVFKVIIKEEQLTLDEHLEPQGTWEEDLELMLTKLVEDKQPCYLFFRLDSENESGCEWIFVSWSPDNSPVREKMLYASTKATLKKEFGGGHVKHEIFASAKEDVTLRGYKKFLRSSSAPAPLTFAEEELQNIKKHESRTDVGVDTKHQTLQGVAFPISDAAVSALFDLKDEVVTYVQLSIDIENEEINLEKTESTPVKNLARKVPMDHARYHLFRFPHHYEGDLFTSVVFIYSMPGYSCSVKERMLYSSCKNPLLDAVENKIGIEVAKKIETDDPAELTEDFLVDQIHPKLNIYKQKFAKPKGPGNRGARRLIKAPQEGGGQA